MNTTSLARLILPVSMLVFIAVALLWPIVRLWRREGVFAVTSLRNPDPIERFVGLVFTASVGVFAPWTLLYGLLGPEALGTSAPSPLALGLGVATMALGVVVVVVAQAQMGRSWRIGIENAPTDLVTDSLYRWIRSPIYTGVIALCLGVTIVSPGPLTGVALAIVIASVMWQARREEQHLQRLHPQSFTTWAAQTGRFFPFIGRL